MQKKHLPLSKSVIFPLLTTILLVGQACTLSLFDNPLIGGQNDSSTQMPDGGAASSTPVPSAKTQFTVHIPTPLNDGDVLAISILDEVTGLPFNSTNYPLKAVDAQTYSIELPLPLETVIKYRYIIAGNNILNAI